MLKKLCALIMAFAMVASLLVVGVGATGNGLVRGDYKYYQMVENVKTECEKTGVTGDIITEVPVMNDTDAATDAALIVAVYNTANGKITDVDYTAKSLASKEVATIAATVTVPNDENTYEIKEYLWNGLAKMVPGAAVETVAPEAPANLVVTGTTTTSTISLTWDAVTTTGATVLGYNIYRDGVKVESTVNTTYTDYELNDGTEYSYTVKAFSVNGEGAASAEIKETTFNIATIDVSTLVNSLTDSKLYQTGSLINTGDTLNVYDLKENSNFTAPTFVEASAFADESTLSENVYNIGNHHGKIAYAMNNLSSGKYAMVFQVPNLTTDAKRQLRTATGDTTRTFIFEYFDNGTSPICLKYRTGQSTWSNTYTAVSARTNTNTWKTCVVTVTNAGFTADNQHLQFDVNKGNGAIYISKVGIAKNYVPKAEVLDADSLTAETGVLKYTFLNDENVGITSKIEGDATNTTAFYITRTASEQPKMRVSVKDSYILKADRNKIKIRITYWDYVNEGKKNRIQLNYAGKVNNEGSLTSIEHPPVVLTGEKTWKTAEFILDNAWFNNGYGSFGSTTDGACDFILATGGGTVIPSDGETLYISKIEVIKIP